MPLEPLPLGARGVKGSPLELFECEWEVERSRMEEVVPIEVPVEGGGTIDASILNVLNPPPVLLPPRGVAGIVDPVLPFCVDVGDGAAVVSWPDPDGVSSPGADVDVGAPPRLRLRAPPRPGAGGSMLCCWRMCFARASERVNDLSHSGTEQTNGFSPV